MFNKNFGRNLYSIELSTWKSFWSFVCGFLGNKREENYPQFMQRLLQNCQKLGWQMSLKIYLLYSHLRFSSENLEAVSDEQGEKFNHGIAKVEQWYKEGGIQQWWGITASFSVGNETAHTRRK
jgi:hypothetical protein